MTYHALGAKRAFPLELPGLRGGVDEAATHAHTMAMRQAAGQMAHTGDLRRRKCGSLRRNRLIFDRLEFRRQ